MLFGTSAFAYDNVGNPTRYKNDTLTWTGGRRLKSYLKDDSSYATTFMYNGDGLRTQKKIQKGTNSFKTHTYYWADGKLFAETIQLNNNMPISLHYHYSHARLTGFTYSKEPFMGEPIIKKYTYIKNSFGDIVGIYSSSGVMCTYTYDVSLLISKVNFNFALVYLNAK